MPTIQEQLAAQGERREKARADARDATARIAKLARRARKQGIAKTEIARLAKISRPALDTLLDE